MWARISQLLRLAGILTLAGLFAAAMYRHSRGDIAAGIYRQRLRQLSDSYDQLRGQYNEAVRKTAVTELVVGAGRLSVVIRTAEGVLRSIPTDLDPAKEVHVEYIARDGRLWIRRAYTLTDPDRTGRASAKVAMIDPSLADLPWRKDENLQGLSVFRKELAAGRWVVTTTGNAALTLTKLAEGASAELSAPPPVRNYAEIEQEVERKLEELSLGEVLEHMLSGE
jgi:hypothetical protein